MSFFDKSEIWREFSANPPAHLQAIEKFEAESRIQLPQDYVCFLQKMNGGEGEFGESYLALWSIDDIVERNRGYMVAEATPGLLVFGSDGGNEAFGFDLRSNAKEIVAVPFIVLDWKDSIRVAPTFTAFLEAMYEFGPDALFKSSTKEEG